MATPSHVLPAERERLTPYTETAARARIRQFVNEYCKDFNGPRAARVVGYKNVHKAVFRLLNTPAVKRAITRRLELRAQRNEVTVERTVAELAKIAYANIKDLLSEDVSGNPFVDITKIDRDLGAAIQEITVNDRFDKDGTVKDRSYKVKLYNKTEANTAILRYLGALADRVLKIDGEVNVTHRADGQQVREEVSRALQDIGSRVLAAMGDKSSCVIEAPAKANGKGNRHDD